MSSGDLELLDILYVVANDNQARLQVGDLATNKGVGQDLPFLAPDGFLGLPNPPANGKAGQAIVLTLGNDRFVIASLDGRYTSSVGAMGLGDRAIVSNCDARLKLSQAGNSISLASTGMEVTLDGAAETLTASNGAAELELTTSSASMSLGPASVTLSTTAVTITLGTTTLTVDATGVHVTTVPPLPGALTVNGVPVS